MLELELLLPLGEVVEEPVELLPDGDVVVDGDVLVDGVVVVVELLEVGSDERGVLGDAEGLGDGLPPTRSVSVRLHASVIPLTSARAQRPDSNFFIADDPPLWGVFRPFAPGCNAHARGGTMRTRVLHPAQRRSRNEARRLI